MADKFDDKDIRDSAKNLQKLQEKLSGDQKKIVADAAKLLGSLAQKTVEMQDQIANASKDATQQIKKSYDVLFDMGDNAISTGKQLQNMFDAMVSLPMDSIAEDLEMQNKKLNETLLKESELYKKGHELKQQQEDKLKLLEEQFAKEQDISKRTGGANKSTIDDLTKQIAKKQKAVQYAEQLMEKSKATFLSETDKGKAFTKNAQKLEGQKLLMMALTAEAQVFIEKFKEAYDRFVELDKAAADFRKTTGLVRGQMVELEKAALNVNQELITQGVTIEKSYAAAQALVESFSNAQTVTQNQIRAVAQLNTNLGVTEDTAAGFLQKMESVGGLTEQQSIGMAGLAANAAKAAGVPINKVMKDVANASGETLAMMRGNVRQMTLAAIQANRLGVDLQKSANSAKQLLSFTESVDAEMEASVLLGKNLNLNLARQLAFQGDVAGAQAETLRQVKSMGDFNKMNLFQQEALAKASGYTVDELSKMLKNEERLSKLKPEQLKAYESATKALKEQKEETGEQILQQAQMQSAMQQLGNTYAAFKQILADILTPVVNVAVKILIPVLKMILTAFNLILIPVKILAKGIQAAFEPFEPVLQMASDLFDMMNAGIEKIVQGATDFGKLIIKLIPGWWLMLNAVKAVGYVIIGLGKSITIIGNLIRWASLGFGLLSGIINPIVGMIVGSFSLLGSLISLVGRGVTSIGRIILFLGQNFKLIDIFVRPVIAVFNTISSVATRLMRPISGLISFFGTASGMVGRLATGLGSIGRVARILGAFKTAVPVIGWIIAALQGIVSMFTKLKSGTGFFKALGETLYEIFVEPFRMLFELLGKIPVIGGLFRLILPVFDLIKVAIVGIAELIGSVLGAAVDIVLWPFKKLISVVSFFWDLGKMVFGNFSSILSMLGTVIKTAFNFTPLGIIIKGIGFVISLFKMLISFPGGFMLGLKAVGGMIISTILGPFKAIWDWISNLFVGKSPSKLGQGIVDGLEAIGGIIIDVLTFPFRMVGKLISTIFSSLFGGDILKSITEFIANAIKEFGNFAKIIISFASSIKDILVSFFTEIFGMYKSLISTVVDGIKSIISTIAENIMGVISSVLGAIKSVISLIGGIFGAGKSTLEVDSKVNPLENSSSPAPTTNPSGPGTPPQIDMLAEMQKTNNKLDQLIQLMANGGLVVNLDGRKVSEQLAFASENV